MINYLTSVVHAKPSSHVLFLALIFIETAWHYVDKQPLFIAWFFLHPALQLMVGTLQAGAAPVLVYFDATKRAA